MAVDRLFFYNVSVLACLTLVSTIQFGHHSPVLCVPAVLEFVLRFILSFISCVCRFSVSLYWLCVYVLFCLLPVGVIKNNNFKNKSVQSNLGRGPRRGAVAHARRKVPIGYKKYPFRGPIPKTCLIPGPVRSMMPNGIRIRSAVFPQCTGETDARIHR